MAVERKVVNPTREEIKQGFREDLSSVIAVVESLQDVCESTADLVEVLRLAESNEGQLHLLMKQVMTGEDK